MKIKSNFIKNFVNRIAYKSFSVSEGPLIKTALNEHHRNVLKAKMVGFEGFDMPVQYSGIIQEHFACRQNAALFDVSHMGQVRIHGKDRYDFLESLCVADLKDLKVGNGALTVFTNKNGGIIDDSIITNMDNYLAVVFNAGRKNIDLQNLQDHLNNDFKGKDVKIEHLTEKSLIAFQGPKAASALQNLVTCNLQNLGFMEQVIVEIPKLGEKIGIMRCGYTGEDGFEISVSNANAVKLWDLLYTPNNSEGIIPAGLGARDSLRLEAGLCLYGHDLNETITPIEASLKWLVGKRRKVEGGYRGSEIISNQINGKLELTRQRVGFTFTNGPPAREGSIITTKEGQEIGKVTSGTQSPVLKYNVGMAYIKPEHSKLGTELLVKVRNSTYPIKVSKMPFVPSKYFKKEKSK